MPPLQILSRSLAICFFQTFKCLSLLISPNQFINLFALFLESSLTAFPMQVQGRAFLEAKHASSLAQLTKALEAELWSAVPVPAESQAAIKYILARADLKPVQTDSHPDENQANGEPTFQLPDTVTLNHCISIGGILPSLASLQ